MYNLADIFCTRELLCVVRFSQRDVALRSGLPVEWVGCSHII
jgi:hypothetical protein